MKAQVRVKNLDVTYFKGKNNEVKALKNISLEIFPGEFIIFFGPSGCGKSTLLYSIAGLESGIDGDIYIDEKNISEMKDREFEKYHQTKIGMVFQAYYLIPSISVLKNVVLPQMAIGKGAKERKEKAEKLLKHFGVHEQKDKLPTELSGGQQQRVAISRSLVNDPDIILADEPVGNLDSKSALDVMNLFKELNEKQKKTVILVTHDATHLDMADRVFYMKDGEHQDIKVNKTKFERVPAVTKRTKEVDLLEKTYGKLGDIEDTVSLEQYKARHIVMEILTGYSVDELAGIESRVDQLLTSGSGNYNAIFRYLDKKSEEGGLDMDIRTARKITKELSDLSKRIHVFHEEKIDMQNQIDEIREYLVSEYDVKIKNFKMKIVIDKLLKQRIENDIDKVKFRKGLDLPTKKGGAGLDSRIAQKITRRMELLMLGKYQLMFRKETKKLKLIDRK
ncbi:ABC transporter ATP-binding protein [Candidatus Parcubacteria bacterium]|jgi:putative ABC transport system ATP-binding protein|nr:ABC transporter ATP-binding protein [Candidatus Parcubacteria bacterium]MBT7228036.1 ABC transporter ATP-binding protein [Candidatus Parcubacteria bacterium]